MGFDDLQFSADAAPLVEVKHVAVRTRVRSVGKDAHLDKSAGGSHELQLKNLLNGGMSFELTCSHQGAVTAYDGSDPGTWTESHVVNKPRRGLLGGGAKWVPRTRTVQHPGTCGSGSGHAIRITGTVRGANPAENIAYTAQELNYQFSCAC